MAGATIEFQFGSVNDKKRFLREYLADAWERFEASEFFETGWFWRFNQFAEYHDVDGLVLLIFDGDPDDLIAAEREHWQNFDGLDSWERCSYENSDVWTEWEGYEWHSGEGYNSVLEEEKARKGEIGGEWQYRLLPLAARFSLEYIREFDDPLPAVDDATERNRTGVGFWAHLHYAMLQCGYDWYDETDACLKDMKFRLKTLVSDRDADAARAEYERLKAELDAYGEELEEWIEEHPNGEVPEL